MLRSEAIAHRGTRKSGFTHLLAERRHFRPPAANPGATMDDDHKRSGRRANLLRRIEIRLESRFTDCMVGDPGFDLGHRDRRTQEDVEPHMFLF